MATTPHSTPIHCVTCEQPLPLTQRNHPHYFAQGSIGQRAGQEVDWAAEDLGQITLYMEKMTNAIRGLVELANKAKQPDRRS